MVDWNEETDVVVIGSGGGLAGAYTAAREGLSVKVIEATDKFGGTTAYSGAGLYYPNNAVLKRAGDDDTPEDAREYFRAVVGDTAPVELQDAYLDNGPALIDYLEEDAGGYFEFMAYPWPDYFHDAPKSRPGGRHIMPALLDPARLGTLRDVLRPQPGPDRLGMPLPEGDMFGGQSLIGRFLMALTDQGVDLQLGTSFEEFVVEDGAVVGVIVDHAGKRETIRARRGVIVAAGGFERNDAMRAKYGVPGVGRDTMGPEANLGKPIQAGIEIGADIASMSEAWWSPGLTHPEGNSAFSLCFTSGIFVNQEGVRFTNEGAPYDRAGRDIIEQMEAGTTTLPFWMIYDNRTGGIPPIDSCTQPMVEPEKYYEAGLWKTADTIAELAEQIGVPADALVATVERFNKLAANGVDEDFGRGNEPYDRAFNEDGNALVPLEQGPFYAATFGISDLGTKGGLVTDTTARVLDASGNPIPGLYASGNSMAPASGNAYPGGGNPVGASMLFSHLAAKDMVANR